MATKALHTHRYTILALYPIDEGISTVTTHAFLTTHPQSLKLANTNTALKYIIEKSFQVNKSHAYTVQSHNCLWEHTFPTKQQIKTHTHTHKHTHRVTTENPPNAVKLATQVFYKETAIETNYTTSPSEWHVYMEKVEEEKDSLPPPPPSPSSLPPPPPPSSLLPPPPPSPSSLPLLPPHTPQLVPLVALGDGKGRVTLTPETRWATYVNGL